MFGGHERGAAVVWTDGAGLLRRLERQRVEAELKRFRVRFPQLFFAVHTVVLEEWTSLRQFGFWLLNRAAFRGSADGVDRDGGILLAIDRGFADGGI